MYWSSSACLLCLSTNSGNINLSSSSSAGAPSSGSASFSTSAKRAIYLTLVVQTDGTIVADVEDEAEPDEGAPPLDDEDELMFPKLLDRFSK